MSTKTSPTPISPTTQSTDVPSITNHPEYADAVKRVNMMVKHYRDVLNKLPAPFPNETQHKALVRMHLGKDVSITFRTGGGKTLMFVLFPIMLVQPKVYIFEVPLITIMEEHKQTFLNFGYPRNTVYTMQEHNVAEIIQIIEQHDDKSPLVIIGSPEAFVQDGSSLCAKLPIRIRKQIVGLMIDEAQMVLEWGDDFRKCFKCLVKIRDMNPLMRTVTGSGSTNPAEREAIRINLDLTKESQLVGPLSRMDLRWDVEESSSMPSRIPIEIENVGVEVPEEGNDEQEHDEEESILKTKASDALKLNILNQLIKYPNDGILCYCESVEQCEKFAKQLCDFFAEHQSTAVALPFYRKAPKAMEAILEAFNDVNDIRVLCCTVVLGMGINPRCNNRAVLGAVLKRLAPTLSSTKQFADRAHRNYMHDPASYGPILAVLNITDFRRHIARAFALQGSFYDDTQHELGKRLENAAHIMFSLFSNPSECIQKMINMELKGSDGDLQCNADAGKACCNCRRRRQSSEAARTARTDGIKVMQLETSSVKDKTAALKSMTCTYMVPTNKKKRPSKPSWIKSVDLLATSIPAIVTTNPTLSKKRIIKVLVNNQKVTALLRELITKELRKYRYGVTFALLVKTVEKGTGSRGLTNSQTRWAITQFLYQGMIEEEEDASPDPEGYERKVSQTRKMHTKVTLRGLQLAIWPTVEIHERCGYFI